MPWRRVEVWGREFVDGSLQRPCQRYDQIGAGQTSGTLLDSLNQKDYWDLWFFSHLAEIDGVQLESR